MRKLMIVLFCIGVLVSWQLWEGDKVNAGDNVWESEGKVFKCSPAGIWEIKNSGGLETVVTFTPLDPTGKRFAIISEDISPPGDLTLGGVFPDAVHESPLRGISVRTSPGNFESTQYSFVVNADGTRAYEIVVSATSMMIDCDNRVASFAFELLTPDGISFFCGTGTSKSRRLKMVPPCDDLPPYPDF